MNTLSIKIALCGSLEIIKIKDNTVDIKDDLTSGEQIDKLQLETKELKKELERERLLHNLLYKEWKELQEQTSAREHAEIEHQKSGNIFYKFAFYILLVLMIPVVYFLYPAAGFQKTAVASHPKVDSTFQMDSSSTLSTSSAADTIAEMDAVPAPGVRKKNNESAIPKAIVAAPVIKTPEKKITLIDSVQKRPGVILRKPVIEGPVTDDIRDSIASEGFSAYFYHNRNPYRRSSERYKIWVKGWNNGKDEAKKVVAKDPSLKDK